MANRIVLSHQAVVGMSEAQITNRLLLMAQKAGWEHPARGTIVRRSDTLEIEYFESEVWEGYCIDGPLKGSYRSYFQNKLVASEQVKDWADVRTYTYEHRDVWVNQVPYEVWVCGGTAAIHEWHEGAWAASYWLNLVPIGRWQPPEETYVDVDVEDLIDRWIGAHA